MTGALLRLEGHAVARARWFYGALALCTGLVGFFLLVAVSESSVLGFTGFGKVMGGVVLAGLLLLPLLGLFSTSQAVTSARASGVLEWYLAHPVGRADVFWAIFLPRVGAVALPAVGAVVVLGVVAVGLGQPVPLGLLAGFAALLAGQGFCFSAVGMWVSAVSRTSEQALVRGLFLWIAAALLVDFVLLGVLLRWELPAAAVFALAALNPMQAGRVGILAAIDAGMGALGPVGTWATVTLGAPATLGWGLGWPVVLGSGFLLLARRAVLLRDST